MIIEFYDISTEGHPMIKEVNGVSRIPEIGDMFEFTISVSIVSMCKVMSLTFGYYPPPATGIQCNEEYCKVMVAKLKVIEEISKPCAKSDCDRPRESGKIYCKEHLEIERVGASYPMDHHYRDHYSLSI